MKSIWLSLALVSVILVTTAVRVAPLVEGGDRLRRQCVSEDGYLMLTVARNIALGNGFSISDGEIRSNGVQPLAVLIYALCFVVAGGDRLAGLYPVVALQVVLSMMTAFMLFHAVGKYFYRGPHSQLVAILVAVAWYVSPTTVMQTQNSLETGLCALLILCAITLYDVLSPRLRRGLCPGWCMAFGVMLGVTFLGRNDACLLIAVLLGVHLALGFRNGSLGRAVRQSFIIGGASVFTALPWLWFNVSRFGHIVPVSGRAEALNVHFGNNFWPAFASLVENATIMLRIPGSIQHNSATQVISMVVVILGLLLAYAKRRWLAERFSAAIGVLACFVGSLFLYYAFFFGMPSFLNRYLFPAVMLCAIILVASAVAIVGSPPQLSRRSFAGITTAAAVLACFGFNGRIYAKGREHLHSQVVDWVAANVPDDVWVGAVQTGTLGYYHDRTINLDGKVDPFAFEARAQDRIYEYVIRRDVEYIVDWVGISTWAERREFSKNYKLVVRDADLNLAVLKRRGTARSGDER